ncbi:MAG: ATP-binding protein [Desulfobacterales bacterium]|nr:ATP-binding protein [Desulfobacterales bacterium]
MITLVKTAMKYLSLKWVLFFFYLVFGFLPLVAVSFMTMMSKSQTIERITQDQMQISLTQIGLRMDMFYDEARDDLSGFARLMEVPCSASELELDYRVRLELLILKFLSEHDQFDIVAFCLPNSDVVAAADREMLSKRPLVREGDGRLSSFDHNRILNNFMKIETRYLPLIFDVRNILMGDETRDGYILGLIPINRLADIFHTADFGKDTRKQIVDFTGQNLWQYPKHTSPSFLRDPEESGQSRKIQTYVAGVDSLGWELIARIDDAVVFRTIYDQLFRNGVITVLVFIMAAGFVYEISRRVTTQLQNILRATRAFGDGELDHRVEHVYGRELTALSGELNQMAKKIKERQSSLVQTNKLESLGLFTAGIAHEIKNPLASIKTSSQVLKSFFMDKKEDKPAVFDTGDIRDIKTLSNGITDEVNRLNTMLRELLNFARPTPSNKQFVDVAALVDKSLAFLQPDLAREKIRVECRTAPFEARIDGDQFIQILMNILLNARNAVRDRDGLIQIFTGKDTRDNGETFRILTVSDNGPGIPEEVIDKVFDPFFSLSRNGSGLGLSIVYTLSNKNNIDITISAGENGGTRFVLGFPEKIR